MRDVIPEEAATAIMRASRILARHGVVDAFGHVSMRHPQDPSAFLISRNMAPALVGADDVMRLDESGAPDAADDRKPFLERFIHAAIYRARPDVEAVVHSHSPAVIPFGVAAGASLRPVFHMAAFLAEGASTFEIRDAAGEGSDMLIRDAKLGDALAAKLGDAAAVLMRGHGSTVVGGSVPEAVFRAIYLEVNARIQTAACQLGPVTFLSAAEAANAAAANAGQIGRAWDLWCSELGSREPASPLSPRSQ